MFESASDYVSAVKGLFTIIRDPYQTDAVFEIGKGIRRSGILNKMAARGRAQSPELDRLIGERYAPPVPVLAELLQLPEGSLGRVYAENLTRAGFDVEFYPRTEVTDDGSYMILRLRRTHDIWHAVTGFGTDPAGELGLQAFMLAQVKSPLSVLLIGSALLRTLRHPEERRRALAEIRRGYRMGREAKPLVAQRWEDGWARPLSEWRAALGLSKAAA
jgi:ubiquinone biosynthesis protein COQ4